MKQTLMLAAASLCAIAAYAAETTATEAVSTEAVETAAKTPANEAEVPKRPELPAHVKSILDSHPNLVARISPFGSTCVEGEECPVKVTKALEAAVVGVTRSGDVIYEGVCAQCHDAGLIGAPMFGDKAAWASRLGKGKATLYNHAINGFNAMPARGGAEISDDEVKNAVDYMLKGSS